jgi:hypothetical protein
MNGGISDRSGSDADLALHALLVPLTPLNGLGIATFRTNCSAASRTSSSVVE